MTSALAFDLTTGSIRKVKNVIQQVLGWTHHHYVPVTVRLRHSSGPIQHDDFRKRRHFKPSMFTPEPDTTQADHLSQIREGLIKTVGGQLRA